MQVNEIHKLSIQMGREADIRSSEQIDRVLENFKKKYDKMSKKEKEFFDKERLTNPYIDSRIQNWSGNHVKKVMAGIDADEVELLKVIEINRKNRSLVDPIDLVIGHHPMGSARVYFTDVMAVQVELMHQYGVPVHIAEKLLTPRMEEIRRGMSPVNHYKVVDTARALGIQLMCVHTPADNLCADYLRKELAKKDHEYVSDVLETLKGIPEYKIATKKGIGPTLFAGSMENRCGKIGLTGISGGTSGSDKIYEHLSRAGIGTIIQMHIPEKHLEVAKEYHMNVIIAGHMASDSLGMNQFLDELEKKGIEIVPCSGLIRVSRNKVEKKKIRKKVKNDGDDCWCGTHCGGEDNSGLF